MSELRDTVEAICSLPDAFSGYTRPSARKSARALAMESGFPEVWDRISAADLIAYLNAHPESIRHWQCWSEDKRVTEGWYYLGETREVGWYSKEGGLKDVRRYGSDAAACAEFILRELQALTA
jgi:hypothetical protein